MTPASTASAIALRPVEPGDFEAIAGLTNHFIRTSTIHFGTEEVTADELREGWSSHPEYPHLVAVDSSGLLGFAKASSWRARAAYRWTAETGIYLRPEAHGRGLGKRLYVALLDALRARGFRSAIGGVALPNEASVALHRSLGFVDAGVVREAGYKHGRWNDVAFFQKQLNGTTEPPGPLKAT